MRTALFDLDGTLFDRAAAVQALVAEQRDTFAADLEHVPRAAYVARVLALDAHGHGDKSIVYRQIATEFHLSTATAHRLLDHFWTRYVAHSRLFPEVLATLGALRCSGIKLGVITDGATAVQEPVIRALGLDSLLDVVLISERERVRKPDAEIFRRALAALGIGAAEAWFVGDHPTTDVAGAAAAGLTAVWRRNAIWGSPDAPHVAIDTLAELLPRLVGFAHRLPDECRCR